MDYSKTRLSFLQEDCISEFGQDKGMAMYSQACERLASMLADADYRGNQSVKTHISKNMFPTIAYYLTLRANGYSKEDAYALTLKETQRAAHIQKKKNEAFGKFPFAFPLFKLFIKGVMKMLYPVEGWEIEWVKLDNQEARMNFKRCIYLDLTVKYDCPELCTVFCKNDPTVFAGYEPNIRFARSGTLAEGGACCDFHFMRA